MNTKNVTKQVTIAGLIAALYVVLVLVFNFASFGPVQARVAEMLSILPYFTPAAIPGLFIGCLIGNIVGGAALLDIIFGSLTTLLAAIVAYRVRRFKWLVGLPAVLFNAVSVGFILKYVYVDAAPIYLLMLSVLAGQVVAVYILGMPLLYALEPIKNKLFSK